MDFKVAGTHAGLTAVQLDMKVPGLSPGLLAEALQPARAAREQLMAMMEAAAEEHEAPADDVAVFGSAEINKELLVGGGLGCRDLGSWVQGLLGCLLHCSGGGAAACGWAS